MLHFVLFSYFGVLVMLKGLVDPTFKDSMYLLGFSVG